MRTVAEESPLAKVDLLVCELKAIELWDIQFFVGGMTDLDIHSFQARRQRRTEVLAYLIGLLREMERQPVQLLKTLQIELGSSPLPVVDEERPSPTVWPPPLPRYGGFRGSYPSRPGGVPPGMCQPSSKGEIMDEDGGRLCPFCEGTGLFYTAFNIELRMLQWLPLPTTELCPLCLGKTRVYGLPSED